MKKIGLLLLGLVLTTSAIASKKTERERLVEQMAPYGKQGKVMVEAIDLYAEKCNLKGEELTILIYWGSTIHGEEVKKAAMSSKNVAALREAISKSECPT